MRPTHRSLIIAIAGLVAAGTAHAEQIKFSGTVEVGCSLQVQDGLLAINRTYSRLATDQAGGSPARLTVTAVGGTAHVAFSAPQWGTTAPSRSLPPTIQFTSNRGASQSYTEQATSPVAVGSSGDVFTIHARADNPFGFPAGDYEITTIATCTG